ncbi:hypothetical protein LGH70_18420 [Hymenobacter sp. BT635]|uniref:Chorismate lyase n=1 Tax=Hymenobacter nitidus TaxID=2880929 RepID=A0ABS8AGU7_9BACT|nr:hypothetical protein [Hymenobacter nitidus]MCB2379577.1 hypothetical protein [Hymenobacter nitidus]
MNQSVPSSPSCLGRVCILDLAANGYQAAAATSGMRQQPSTLVGAVRFVLRQVPGSISCLHLSLYCHDQQLAHWMLLGSSARELALRPPAQLVETSLAVPVPGRIIDAGTCQLRRCATDKATLEHDLRAGSLQLMLGGTSLRGWFFLERSHYRSQTWELGRMRQPYALRADA